MGGFAQRAWTPTKKRGPIAAEFTSPGPACVHLPPYIGHEPKDSRSERAPAFSFGNRSLEKVESVGPGPGQYNITGQSAKGKDTPPAISLNSRPKPLKQDIFPAPGQYNANNKYSTSSPKYTFGSRTNVNKLNDTPAPNVYNIASSVGDLRSSPAYTISGRHKEMFDERIRNPGPGQYTEILPELYKIHSSPTYSISGRHPEHQDTCLPGPGMYSPEKVDFDCTPAHSFGIKHSPYIVNF